MVARYACFGRHHFPFQRDWRYGNAQTFWFVSERLPKACVKGGRWLGGSAFHALGPPPAFVLSQFLSLTTTTARPTTAYQGRNPHAAAHLPTAVILSTLSFIALSLSVVPPRRLTRKPPTRSSQNVLPTLAQHPDPLLLHSNNH